MTFHAYSVHYDQQMYFGGLSRRFFLYISIAIPCALLVLAAHYSWQRGRQRFMVSRSKHNTLAEKYLRRPRKHIIDISSKVNTLWQKWIWDEDVLCLPATVREFLSIKPKIPDGKTRVRWKCVSYHFVISPSQ
jgi:hypothetical protein